MIAFAVLMNHRMTDFADFAFAAPTRSSRPQSNFAGFSSHAAPAFGRDLHDCECRWCSDEEALRRKVADAERAIEEAWLGEHIYAPEQMSRMDAPVVREVTWLARHG